MTDWHPKLRQDIGLRAAGTALCAISYVCIRYVVHRHALDPAYMSADAIVFTLITVGFLSASLGGAMAMLGYHLFDRIEVSERWQPCRDQSPSFWPHSDDPSIDGRDPSFTPSAMPVRSPPTGAVRIDATSLLAHRDDAFANQPGWRRSGAELSLAIGQPRRALG